MRICRIKGYIKQLKTDNNFKEVTSIGRARYQVKYEREGRFFGAMQMVTFVSRQAPIFRIRTWEDGRISVAGSGAGRQYADKLKEVGLNTQGLFRVVTDAEVIEHNAEFVRASSTPGSTCWWWTRWRRWFRRLSSMARWATASWVCMRD